MNLSFGEILIKVDKEATEQFYLDQDKVVDNCSCTDCQYFVNDIITQPWEVFRLLRNSGVDIEKSLNSDPAGAYVVRDDDGKLLHCDQSFQIFGKILSDTNTEIKYSKFEAGFRIVLKFKELVQEEIFITLIIDLRSDGTIV